MGEWWGRGRSDGMGGRNEEGMGEWWRVMRGEGGVVDSDEWGEGSGVGTYERGGSAARLSSSVCALVVCVCAHHPCARSSSMCVLIVHVRTRPSLSKGASSSVGGGRQLWGLGGLSIRGPWSLLVGVGRCSWVLCHCRGRWVVVRGHWVANCGLWGLFPWAGCLCVLVCHSWVRW